MSPEPCILHRVPSPFLLRHPRTDPYRDAPRTSWSSIQQSRLPPDPSPDRYSDDKGGILMKWEQRDQERAAKKASKLAQEQAARHAATEVEPQEYSTRHLYLPKPILWTPPNVQFRGYFADRVLLSATHSVPRLNYITSLNSLSPMRPQILAPPGARASLNFQSYAI